jgi:hypothetical protein
VKLVIEDGDGIEISFVRSPSAVVDQVANQPYMSDWNPPTC